MNASASVNAIPMNMRTCRRPCELGLARDALDGLADDDADADGGADGCEAVADGRDVAVDLGENGSCVHGGVSFRDGGSGRVPESGSVLVSQRELDVDGGEQGEDVGLQHGDEDLEEREDEAEGERADAEERERAAGG